ncbi:MAG: hypothetical protein WD426_19235 [Anditalea sp.]
MILFKTYYSISIKNFTFALYLNHKTERKMAVTTLKRKLKRKRQSQNTRVIKIKQLSAQPVIKNVDVEELKKNFKK